MFPQYCDAVVDFLCPGNTDVEPQSLGTAILFFFFFQRDKEYLLNICSKPNIL